MVERGELGFRGGTLREVEGLMKRGPKFKLVLVTSLDLKTARKLARAALEERLIACANLIPKIESHYRWQGKVEQGGEVLMILKTTASKLAALEKAIICHHPYDTPEFLVLDVAGGAKRYLRWLSDCCAAPG